MRLGWLVPLAFLIAACTGGAPRVPTTVVRPTSTVVQPAATVPPTPVSTGTPQSEPARVLESPVNASAPVAAQPQSAPQPQGGPARAPASAPALIVPFTTSGGALVTSNDLEGAILQGGHTGLSYLGTVSTSRTNADSICNQNGAFGSVYGATSVRNRAGEFGHIPSETSAYDPTAPLPPRILLKNARIGYLTKNITLGRGTIDPDLLFAALGCP
jgi:hypothetical protein